MSGARTSLEARALPSAYTPPFPGALRENTYFVGKQERRERMRMVRQKI
jgi:hypothetical protein